jgi:GNAT superfamily N-acetyltransferase
MPNLEWVISWAVDVDYSDRFALVAETGDPPRIVAHAAYVRGVGARAEVAFLVADELQGRGISTTLLAHLAAVAQRNGIETFTAEVMPSRVPGRGAGGTGRDLGRAADLVDRGSGLALR